jgi:hypothetical protein
MLLTMRCMSWICGPFKSSCIIDTQRSVLSFRIEKIEKSFEICAKDWKAFKTYYYDMHKKIVQIWIPVVTQMFHIAGMH